MPSSSELSWVIKLVEKHFHLFDSLFSDMGSLSLIPSLSEIGLCKCRRKDAPVSNPGLGGCVVAQR
jgi:hypothetical protein